MLLNFYYFYYIILFNIIVSTKEGDDVFGWIYLFVCLSSGLLKKFWIIDFD